MNKCHLLALHNYSSAGVLMVWLFVTKCYRYIHLGHFCTFWRVSHTYKYFMSIDIFHSLFQANTLNPLLTCCLTHSHTTKSIATKRTDISNKLYIFPWNCSRHLAFWVGFRGKTDHSLLYHGWEIEIRSLMMDFFCLVLIILWNSFLLTFIDHSDILT